MNVALKGNDVHALIDPAQQSAAGISTSLRSAGIGVSDVRTVDPTLEDVFIYLASTAKEHTA